MAEHNELGTLGEKLAVDFLQKNGYKILETNWSSDKLEVDIIAMDKDVLVIVEVKTRQSTYFGEPEAFVNKTKQKNLIRAANAFIYKRNLNCETRFDIISIVKSGEDIKIDHIKDAFYPTL
jgi:putative endonuclease